jgi:hypothetical protein
MRAKQLIIMNAILSVFGSYFLNFILLVLIIRAHAIRFAIKMKYKELWYLK